MKVLKKIDSIILKTQEQLCVFTGICMVLLIVVAALMRLILNINFSGSEEIILFCAFWFYFMGSSAAAEEDSHITADMSGMLIKNEKVLSVIRVIKYLLSTIMSAIATKWAYSFLEWNIQRNPRTAIYKLPEVIMVLPVFISFVLMTIYLFRYLIKEIMDMKRRWNT